ncbi:SIS domain-containing protein [Ignisphaera sp. 4213-co]|uniref:SIS domain-containing protein n=1 Tax=Ignisphaera cupida TaxID=3050454 RepID=A0ABD4Z652_9CREN|nr:SIS domain-containing protein [Ignisphaera sp. 4213-co]MDK6028482.1 SIS domain-containing protein [Ignisphaera sp. 4213-co]
MQITYKTLEDISEIPRAITSIENSTDLFESIARDLKSRCKHIYMIGCGSSYYIAMLSSFPIHKTKLMYSYATPSSEFIMYHNKLEKDCCVIAFSRSGETAETLEALKKAKELGAYTVMVSISKSEKGMSIAEKYVYVDVGIERGVVMTKSFVTLSLTGLIISMMMVSGKEVIDLLRNSLNILSEYFTNVLNAKEIYINIGKEIALKNLKRFVFLGSGPSYPIALEASLKVKETSYTSTEALYSLEFRHGPIATLGEEQVITIFNQHDNSYSYVYKLYKELRERIKGLEKTSLFIRFSSRDIDDNTIELPKIDIEEFEALSAILPIQLIAVGYATTLGVNVDAPRNLVRFVEKF